MPHPSPPYPLPPLRPPPTFDVIARQHRHPDACQLAVFVQAAVATAVRHNLTGLMLDYEPRHNYTQDHADQYAGFVANLTK